MTVLEYLQSLDLETRVAVVGCVDNALRGIRNLDEQTAAAASFGLWACPDYLAQQLGLAFNCNYPASADDKRCTRCAGRFPAHENARKAERLWQINTREKGKATMNENERAPAETAADYAVHFADGFFVPCPCCGKEVESPDNGFTSEKEAMEWGARRV